MKKRLIVLSTLVLMLTGCTRLNPEQKDAIAYIESMAPEGSTVTYAKGIYNVALSRTGIRIEDTQGWEDYKADWLEIANHIDSKTTPKLHLTYNDDTVLDIDGQTITFFTPIDCGCGI